MIFSILYREKYVSKYWGDKREDRKPAVEFKNEYSYRGLDYEQFMHQLRETADPPLEDLTAEQVKNDFGPKLSDKCAKKIMEYYNWRKKLYDRVVEDVKAAAKQIDSASARSKKFKYSIPEEFNSFTTSDDGQEPVGQQYAEIEVEVSA